MCRTRMALGLEPITPRSGSLSLNGAINMCHRLAGAVDGVEPTVGIIVLLND